ncbi:IclR family transcriptional regulator [Dysgonomonas sp. ZJ709]|uniref:IclR family transcriptional regulator n=1 Tax=Dysgonomonas sp. ZJ709 TaxID=2709797 RepID=UPI0013EBA951|nr:IclR family transcriptional regulator [Dysgonomonas sp. ZJ709]
MKEKEDKNNVSMITKSMELLELLSRNEKGLTLQEIVNLLPYPKSSIYKIATNLQELGYLGKEPDSFRYFLSRKLLSVGLAAVSGYDIIERSKEYMKRLSDEIGESVMIGTLLNDEVILLEQVTGTLDFVFILKRGMRFNLYSTAPGKVLLAFLSFEERNEKISELQPEAINEYTITDKGLLQSELARIAKAGYAVDLNETVQGVHCIATPIFDETNNVIACIWTSGPAGRLPEAEIPRIAQLIIDAGLAISNNIGYKKSK